MKTPSELSEMLNIYKAKAKRLSEINVNELSFEKKLQLIRIYLHYYCWIKYIQYVLKRIPRVDFPVGGNVHIEEINECCIVKNSKLEIIAHTKKLIEQDKMHFDQKRHEKIFNSIKLWKR